MVDFLDIKIHLRGILMFDIKNDKIFSSKFINDENIDETHFLFLELCNLENKKKFIDTITVINFLTDYKNFFNKKTELNVIGEYSIYHKHILSIIQTIKTLNFNLKISLYNFVDYSILERIININPEVMFKFCFTIDTDYENFKEYIKEIKNFKKNFYIVLGLPNNSTFPIEESEFKKFLTFLDDFDILYDFDIFRKNHQEEIGAFFKNKSPEYIQKNILINNENYISINEIKELEKSPFMGMTCDAVFKSFIFSSDGKIQPWCYNYKKNYIYIYKNENSFKEILNNVPNICNLERCTCSCTIKYSKKLT